MRSRLPLNLMLVAVASAMGCASSPLRPLTWWRHRTAQSHGAQSPATVDEVIQVDALSSAPPKLPPGIELPPEPKVKTQTLPSGATQPPEIGSQGVIFASSQGN